MASSSGAGRAPSGVPWLVGRDHDLSELGDMVDNVGVRGGALMIRGQPGVGKTALLAAAVARAAQKGLAVRRAVGVPSEAQLPFAGLHQLLQPFLGRLPELPVPQRRALESALGMTEGDAPDIFLIGLATVGLLAAVAQDAPVLLVVDDAHWLDRPSCEVLAFVGRRLEPEAVLVLLAARDTGPSDAGPGDVEDGGVPEMRVGALDDSAARRLLRAAAPTLPAYLQERVLREAAGNPLALIELPAAAAQYRDRPGVEPLPLTARLESAFAGRIADVKEDARLLLLLAALDDGPVERQARAAEIILGQPAAPGALDSAAAAGLGSIAGERFEFRHPLVRSAVQQAASAPERRRAHLALARVLATSDIDRSVWHEAAAATGPDEGVATRLERSAERAERRGGVEIALAAFERAAVLSADTTTRSDRLVRAADLAFAAGRGQAALHLMEKASRLDLPASDRARLAFVLEMMSSAGWSGAGGFRAYLEAARDLAGSRHAGMALYMLESAALRAHFSNLDDSTRGELVALAVELSAGQRGPRFLAALATMDPVGHGAEVIAQVRNRTPVTAESPQDLFALGSAAAAVWSGDLAIPFFYAAIEGFRREGRLGLLAQALNFTAWDEVRRGNTWLAAAAAGEAARLGGDTGQPLYAASSRVVEVIADAGRGQTGAAEPRLAAADGVFLAVGAHPVRALVQLARGLVALACGQYGAAYSRLERMFDPGDVAYHQFMGGWVLADLADAAVHGGADLERVRAILSPWRRIANATSASHLQVQLHYADALLAGDGEAAGRFEEAAAYASADWPYYRARAQLAYGRWLRRRRRAAQARLPLREAVETLDALGAAVLADRARRELRASGESVRRRTAGAWDQLAPQELQIARLAATGLSNREIGERLYLSHRTVGTHLHRLFPKLGVTSRAELRTALEAAGPGTAD